MSGIDAGIRVGKYEVGRELGKGGFGILYVARDHELGRDVAIKFLRPEHVFKPNVVQRFLQEARAAARINHPGIVTVFESGIVGGTNTRADGTVYIAMELLAGETLAQKIRSVGRLPMRLAINYGRQLASALAAAHAAGIVHRDLKPANVFLVRDAAVIGGERVKVLDFGIAKLADDFGSGVQTHSMVMLGTPMYMSPEQCKSSAKVDARSDIYSLGCMLFEMLCGKPPFDGDSGELIAKHQLVPAPTARSVIHEVPEPLDRLVTSMLAKSADERPQTMELVEDALAELDSRATENLLLGGEPATDLGADAPTTVQPSATRRRVPLIAGGLGAALLGIGAGLVTMCGDKKPSAHVRASDDAAIVATTGATDAAANSPTLDAETAAVENTVTPQASDVRAQLSLECQQALADRHWAELSSCSEKLKKLAPDIAKKFGQTARSELANERVYETKIKNEKDYRKAKHALELIPTESVYHQDAVARINALEQDEALKSKGNKSATSATSGVAAPAHCDADALKDQGMEKVNQGQHAIALERFEASLKCKDDAYVVALAFMAACNAQNAAKAKVYWPRLSSAQQMKYKVMCFRNHIDLE